VPLKPSRGQLEHRWLVPIEPGQFRLEGAPALLGRAERLVQRREIPLPDESPPGNLMTNGTPWCIVLS